MSFFKRRKKKKDKKHKKEKIECGKCHNTFRRKDIVMESIDVIDLCPFCDNKLDE